MCFSVKVPNLQVVNAVERDSGDYECQLTGEGTDHEDEDLVLNQKLEINVFDRDKSSSTKGEDDERGGLDSGGGREKTSKAESVLASFVQNDRLRLAAEQQEKEKSVLSRQERKSDERTNFQRSPSSSTGSQLRLSLGLWAALLCSVL